MYLNIGKMHNLSNKSLINIFIFWYSASLMIQASNWITNSFTYLTNKKYFILSLQSSDWIVWRYGVWYIEYLEDLEIKILRYQEIVKSEYWKIGGLENWEICIYWNWIVGDWEFERVGNFKLYEWDMGTWYIQNVCPL